MKLLITFVALCMLGVVSANPNGLGALQGGSGGRHRACKELCVVGSSGSWCTLSSCHQPGNYSHAYHDVCNVWMVKDVAEAIIQNGMQAAGYQYINLDDCWEAAERAPDGTIRADPERFPDGLTELADWLHARNFKFGLYLSAGWTTCSTGGRDVPFIPGSIGHYMQDAKTVASWGTDYIKLDWCGTTNKDAPPYALNQQNATTGFAHAANLTGRDMWMNFHCDHQAGNIPDWCPQAGNSWRMAEDHHDNWSDTIQVINNLKLLAPFAGPTRWNDPDFLMTGGAGCDKNVTGLRCPGQTDAEYKTTFSLWSMAAAPLIVSTDVRNWTDFMKSVLLNKEIIAVDQDPLGVAGGLVDAWPCAAPSGTCQVWARPLSDGCWAAALFNANDDTHGITLKFDVLKGFDTTASATVRDLWAHQDVGTFSNSYSAQVDAHATVMVKVCMA